MVVGSNKAGQIVKRLPLYPIAYGVSIVLICLLSLLILDRLALLPWSESQASTPTKVILNYTNAEYGFSLKFPQYWGDSEESDASIVKLTSPQAHIRDFPDLMTSINIIAFQLPPEFVGEPLSNYVANCEKSLQDKLAETGQEYKQLSLESIEVAGLPAQLIAWSASGEAETLITRQAIFYKDELVYIISYASLEKYDEEYAGALDLVLDTFTFH